MNPMAVFVVTEQLFKMETGEVGGYALRQPRVIPSLTRQKTSEELFGNG